VNEGQSIEHFLQSCPSANIHGFEIQPSAFRTASQKLERYKNVELHNFGFGEVEESGLHISGPVGLEVGGIFSVEGSHWKEWGEQADTASVKPLSLWCDLVGIERVSYLVIDVEGYEPKVLRGMELHRDRNRKRFSIFQYELGGTWAQGDPRHGNDWSQKESAIYLRDLGYDLFLIGENSWMYIEPEIFDEYTSFWESSSWPIDTNHGMGR